ncbi:hypothetical protein T484DRAFT_1862556 [Baffinella frigidus]|nr:hypothetical protein T484DRAFT_1862556 [Cryptophyta sp. CCMP2293]
MVTSSRQGRPTHQNVGRYGSDLKNTCPSKNGKEFGQYINIMLHPTWMRRKSDGEWTRLVFDIFEGGECVFIAEDTIGAFYYKPGSHGDRDLRKLLVATSCAQLIGYAKSEPNPSRVADFIMPIISEVVDELGFDGPDTVLHATDDHGREIPMYKRQYAELIEETCVKLKAKYAIDDWTTDDPSDMFKYAAAQGLIDPYPEELEKDEADLAPALPADGIIDVEEQFRITKEGIEQVVPRVKGKRFEPKCPLKMPAPLDAPVPAAPAPLKATNTEAARSGRLPASGAAGGSSSSAKGASRAPAGGAAGGSSSSAKGASRAPNKKAPKDPAPKASKASNAPEDLAPKASKASKASNKDPTAAAPPAATKKGPATKAATASKTPAADNIVPEKRVRHTTKFQVDDYNKPTSASTPGGMFGSPAKRTCPESPRYQGPHGIGSSKKFKQ